MRATETLERAQGSKGERFEFNATRRRESHPGVMLFGGMAALYGFGIGLVVGLLF